MSEPLHPLKECDIIMKGGITSGVVFPKAILGLSERYRFRSIGGTSAGAIAAVITAAAEYNRDQGGYRTVAEIPGEIERRLPTLFQPSPETRVAFESMRLAMAGSKGAAIRKLLAGNWRHMVPGTAAGLILAVAAAAAGNDLAAVLLLAIGIAASAAFLAYATVAATIRNLSRLDFGFCPGPTQPGQDDPGLCDWLAERIEVAAGRMTAGGTFPEDPLTFNDIWLGRDGRGSDRQRALELRVMTTNLALRRPHALPRLDGNHFFKREEMARLFPGWVVDYMVRYAGKKAQERRLADPNGEEDPPGYYRFPTGGDLPLIVAARMSLSFPILFSAVPLYRRAYPYRNESGPPVMQRMLFSDGGLSSNFPVHFFDVLLPRRPTFGISLEAFDEHYPKRRVHLPMKAREGIWLDYAGIATLPDFLLSLVNAAKDWQDRLQSTLPGYRERITSVYLREDEGGLNLDMTPSQIAGLTGLGARAGGLMTGAALSADDEHTFDFADHRWRRFLVAFARVEETLQEAAESWRQPGDPTRDFIAAYMEHPGSYGKSPKQWRREVFERFDALMKLVEDWNGVSLRDRHKDYIPRPRTTMRITPVQ